MAKSVKAKSVDTKDYIEMQDELSGGKKISTLSQDELDLWELSLESLLDTLETSQKQANAIRVKLESISRETV